MKLSLAFVFISILSVCVVMGQSESASPMSPHSAAQDGQITNGPVAEYVSDSKCTIGWSTSAPGTMTLLYGTDRTRLTQKADVVESRDGHNHHVRLSGLTPSTRYYFQVLKAGTAISGVGTFHTVAENEAPITSKATIP